MAKKTGKSGTQADAPARTGRTEEKLLDFAEDLGRLLGTAQAKADGWLNQRTTIAEQLAQIRDTANQYLQQLTGGGAATTGGAVPGGRKGRPPGSTNKRAPGRPPGSGRKKKRTMSAEARQKIAAAQRARWAKQKSAAR
jgi:hypothetical protein